MKTDNEDNLLALDGMLKQGVGYVITNSGKIIAAITFIIAILTTFTNITFADFGGETFTIALTVMLISSYIMYFSLEDAGETEGARSTEYTEARGRFIEVRERVNPDDIESLREFCLNYSENELNYRRRNFLCENGFTLSELNRYKDGTKYPKRVRRILKKADSMRAVKLTVARLLSTSQGTPQSELAPPERGKMVSVLVSLIPSTICTLFTVSIILTTKSELSASAVIDGVIKLSALPLIGFKGFLDGYRYSKESKAAWYETKTRVLEAFLIR